MGKRITNEEFLKRLQEKHPGYIALEDYKGGHTKIQFKCNKGHIFEAEPNSVINRGTGCRKCAFNELHQCQAMSKDVFIKKLKQNLPHVDLISKYTKASDRMTFKCSKCGHIWKTSGTNLIMQNNTGCPNCAKAKMLPNLKLGPKSMQIAPDAFIKKMHQAYSNWTLISHYKSFRNQVIVKCNKGHIFKAWPQGLLRKQVRCKKCDYLRRRDAALKQLHIMHPGYKMLSKFIDSDHKATFLCDKGHKFTADTSSVLNASGCPICSKIQVGLKRRLTQNEYAKELNEVHPGWTILSKYETMNTIMRFECEYGHVFNKKADKALQYGCPDCNFKSYGEQNIKKYFREHHIAYVSPFIPATCKDKHRLHYDFKVGNILIEYQGKQHYMPVDHFGGQAQFKVQQRHDEIKRQWAKNNNYNEIEIKYDMDIDKALAKLFKN